jgi:hypothetical protein
MRKPSINKDRAPPPPSYKERSKNLYLQSLNYPEPVRMRESVEAALTIRHVCSTTLILPSRCSVFARFSKEPRHGASTSFLSRSEDPSSCMCSPHLPGFLGFSRSPNIEIPPITEAQAILDDVHSLETKHYLCISFQNGDIYYIYSMEEIYTSSFEPYMLYHLLRIDLQNELLRDQLCSAPPTTKEPEWLQ